MFFDGQIQNTGEMGIISAHEAGHLPSGNRSVIPTIAVGESTQNSQQPNNYFQTIAALISQGINAWGRNPSTQIVGGQNLPIVASQAYGNQYSQNQFSPEQLAYLYQQQQSGLGGGVNGVVQWVQENPLWVLGGVVAVVLLYKQPPSRR